MDARVRPVVGGRRGSKRIVRRRRWLRWLCNPLVLKAVFELGPLVWDQLRKLLRD